MDSLTQFTLGAAFATACLGPKIGPRKAALIGGVLGTLPDLDVFLPFADPVDAFVLHRGWTHSLFVHLAAAPLIGEVLVRVFQNLRDARMRVWIAVFLCLSTHAIIDAITVYGTRLFWPFYNEPVGVGSMFIIDPIYTIPLLVVVVWALFKTAWSSRLKTALTVALMFSTAYILLGVGLQAHVEGRAKAIFEEAGIKTSNAFAIAAPFTTVLWKVIGHDGEKYHNLYLSLFDDNYTPQIYSHPSGAALAKCLDGNQSFQKLKWFSRGYFKLEMFGNQIVFSDLRMGLTPNYVFRFAVAEKDGDTAREITPERIQTHRRAYDQDLEWLTERLIGKPATRLAEAKKVKIEQPSTCRGTP